VGDRTCAACDGPLGGSLICVAVGGKPVEVCSSACAEALNEACVAGVPKRWATSGQQAALTVRSIETPSGRISYSEAGSGAVALFVHGMLLNKHFWRHQLAGLFDIRRCIAVDLLAHGETEIEPNQNVSSAANANIPEMLASNAPGGKLQNAEAAMSKAQTTAGITTWRMSETNSFFSGGATGVSNVEAASLWSLDYMSGVAAHNGAGLNFHGGSTSKYTPITFSGNTPTGVQGVYYGQLLWVLAGTGAYHSASVSGSSSVTAWGIGRNVFVNNKSASPVTATITLPAPAVGGTEYVLTAPSLSSTAITIAGSSVGVDATFTPKPQTAQITGNKAVITVPANSAALLLV